MIDARNKVKQTSIVPQIGRPLKVKIDWKVHGNVHLQLPRYRNALAIVLASALSRSYRCYYPSQYLKWYTFKGLNASRRVRAKKMASEF